MYHKSLSIYVLSSLSILLLTSLCIISSLVLSRTMFKSGGSVEDTMESENASSSIGIIAERADFMCGSPAGCPGLSPSSGPSHPTYLTVGAHKALKFVMSGGRENLRL